MGVVYVADHTEVRGVRRALKCLAPGAPAEFQERFVREGETQARSDAHPNVVRVHEAAEAGGRRYLVMELACGGDLSARLRGGPLPPEEAARIVRDLARGLSHVHARGILHRDLKPANVLFDERGTPKLVDFGLARVDRSSLTGAGDVLGTPVYMAPEQAQGDPVDERTDVYGLGGVLYHALTGRPPFLGKSAVSVLSAVLSKAPAPPSAAVPGLDPALERIVLRALAKDPGDRQPTAAALADALEAWLVGEPAAAEARRPPAALLAAAAAGLVALGGAVAFAVGGPGPGPATDAAPPPPPARSPRPATPGPSPSPSAATDPPPAPAAPTRLASRSLGKRPGFAAHVRPVPGVPGRFAVQCDDEVAVWEVSGSELRRVAGPWDKAAKGVTFATAPGWAVAADSVQEKASVHPEAHFFGLEGAEAFVHPCDDAVIESLAGSRRGEGPGPLVAFGFQAGADRVIEVRAVEPAGRLGEALLRGRGPAGGGWNAKLVAFTGRGEVVAHLRRGPRDDHEHRLALWRVSGEPALGWSVHLASEPEAVAADPETGRLALGGGSSIGWLAVRSLDDGLGLAKLGLGLGREPSPEELEALIRDADDALDAGWRGQRAFAPPPAQVRAVAFTGSGALVSAAGPDVRIWTRGDGGWTEAWSHRHGRPGEGSGYESVAVDEEGHLALGTLDGRLEVWRLPRALR